eukprot:gene4999-6225_t
MSQPEGTVACLANALLKLRTSTNYNSNHSQFNCCLNFANDQAKSTDGSEAWCASINDDKQFIVAGGEVPKTFVGVATQGRGDCPQWVTSYKIRYSVDNVSWIDYNNGQVINANTDCNTVVLFTFPQPIRARSIAIHPVSWNNHISMRLEFYVKPLKESFTQIGQVFSGENCALNTGEGQRYVEIKVVFPEEFAAIPRIYMSYDQIDCTASPSGQTRIGCGSKNVTTKGFDCFFWTWADSKVYSARASYVALEKH